MTSPDPRILLANERTLLAWVRTGLGLMAFGFVVARLGVWLHELTPPGEDGRPAVSRSLVVGAALVLLAAALNVTAAVRYLRMRRAIIDGVPFVPGGATPLLVTLSVAALGLVLAVILAFK